MVLRTRWLIGLPLTAAGCALGALHAFAPLHLLHQGFPLDDGWIHAVYARELARTGMLAYNPGVPATGETAPLWALLMALVRPWPPSRLGSRWPGSRTSTWVDGLGRHVHP